MLNLNNCKGILDGRKIQIVFSMIGIEMCIFEISTNTIGNNFTISKIIAYIIDN